MKLTNLLALVLISAAIACSGCKTMEFGGTNWINQDERPRLRVDLPFQNKKKETFAAPDKMTVIWKESTLATPGNPTVRGFGGRVFFYDAENKTIKVDGEMVVYGYDTEKGSTEANKRFVFQGDKLDDHYGETDLGHSYSFWVPWGKMEGEQKSVTLIPFFKTAEGKLVKGGLSVNMLPGKTPEEKGLETSTYTGKDIELTSGVEGGNVAQAGLLSQSKPEMRETTIRLPKHLGDRISSAPESTGRLNEITISRKAIEVLDEKGNVIDREGEVEKRKRAADERRERAPFGKPQAFN